MQIYLNTLCFIVLSSIEICILSVSGDFSKTLSLRRNAQLRLGFLLLFGQCAEECDLFCAGRFPLVIRLKCALEMRFDIDVEGLWL